MAFKRNDLPMIKMNSIMQNYFKKRAMALLLEIYINEVKFNNTLSKTKMRTQ